MKTIYYKFRPLGMRKATRTQESADPHADRCALAKGFGVATLRTADPREFARQFKRGLVSNGPC